MIVPDKFSNLARFINGINNTEEGAKKKKQNVISGRFNVDNKATVLIYTLKSVKKGEQLFYDYNEGGLGTYDTTGFE